MAEWNRPSVFQSWASGSQSAVGSVPQRSNWSGYDFGTGFVPYRPTPQYEHEWFIDDDDDGFNNNNNNNNNSYTPNEDITHPPYMPGARLPRGTADPTVAELLRRTLDASLLPRTGRPYNGHEIAAYANRATGVLNDVYHQLLVHALTLNNGPFYPFNWNARMEYPWITDVADVIAYCNHWHELLSDGAVCKVIKMADFVAPPAYHPGHSLQRNAVFDCSEVCIVSSEISSHAYAPEAGATVYKPRIETFREQVMRCRAVFDNQHNHFATFEAPFSIRPVFIIVHNERSLHFSLLVTITGKNWYHYDSAPGVNASAACDLLAALYQRANLGEPFDGAKCYVEMDTLHEETRARTAARVPKYTTDHCVLPQPDGTSCLLYSFERIYYFLCTGFSTWPSISSDVVPPAARHRLAASLRAGCVFAREMFRSVKALVATHVK
jgi:hypothetical protein